MARVRRMSVAEWVREALDLAGQRECDDEVEKKLAVIRAAVRHNYPSGNIDTVLSEICGITRLS